MKDGIFYVGTIQDEESFIRIGSTLHESDRHEFMRIEFWNDNVMLQEVPIAWCTHEFLLNLSKNGNWPQMIKNGLLS